MPIACALAAIGVEQLKWLLSRLSKVYLSVSMKAEVEDSSGYRISRGRARKSPSFTGVECTMTHWFCSSWDELCKLRQLAKSVYSLDSTQTFALALVVKNGERGF
mmetsp:Transcript_80246/g.214433  ORF Transcript_80246/g.214433 Transcript_80246/m.214433 type:complete len:105 (+) Transcript_80246:1666-1980(+)